MKSWREDAQPVWPEAASATKEIPAGNEDRDRRVTQVFPEGVTGEARLLRGIPRQSGGGADTDVVSSGSSASDGSSAAASSASVVRDPWQQEPDAAGGTHDPHEVTVQLDAVQVGEGGVRQAQGAPGRAHDGSSDGPVFVDASGRRSRRLRRIGMIVGLACAGYAAVIAVTVLSGNSDAPWLPVPGQRDEQPAGQVDTSPEPAEPAPATDTGAAVPGSAPTTDQVTAPSPDVSAPAPGPTSRPERPDTSAEPKPTPTRTTPKPGPGVVEPTPTQPTDVPTTPAPDPTPTDEPTPDPTDTAGSGDGGTGTVADGQAAPQPIAESPA
ncbi:hypothetical protein [Streptomyces deserti]